MRIWARCKAAATGFINLIYNRSIEVITAASRLRRRAKSTAKKKTKRISMPQNHQSRQPQESP